MIQGFNSISVVRTVLWHKAICCECQRRPEEIRVDHMIEDDGLRVVFFCHGSRVGRRMDWKVARYVVEVPGDLLARFYDFEELTRTTVWWDLIHPFPRSFARYGEVSAKARRERRMRLGAWRERKLRPARRGRFAR